MDELKPSFMGTSLPTGPRSQLLLPSKFAMDKHTDLFTRYVYFILKGFAEYFLSIPRAPLIRSPKYRNTDIVESKQ